MEEAADKARQEQALARETGMREGYETGYREGREKAESECRQELDNTLADFREDMTRALRSVERAKENCLRTYLDELKDCAVAVGEKVIHISLRSSGEVIKQMIIAATEKLKKTAWVKIYIDKYDYDMMMKELEKLESEHPEFDDPLSPSHRVGSDITKGFTQVAHVRPMLSLGNTYSVEEVDDWIRRCNDLLGNLEGLKSVPIVGEMKFDGTSISLIYETGVWSEP